MLRKLAYTFLFLGIFISAVAHAQTANFLSPEFWETATIESVQKAIQHGADVNARFEGGFTPLMGASSNNSELKILDALIQHGADVNTRNKFGATALMAASHTNSEPKIIEILIRHGADVRAKDSNGKTALDYAKDNDKIYHTKVYWKMNDLMYK